MSICQGARKPAPPDTAELPGETDVNRQPILGANPILFAFRRRVQSRFRPTIPPNELPAQTTHGGNTGPARCPSLPQPRHPRPNPLFSPLDCLSSYGTSGSGGDARICRVLNIAASLIQGRLSNNPSLKLKKRESRGRLTDWSFATVPLVFF